MKGLDFMKRFLASLLLIIFLTSLFTACAGDGGNKNPAGETARETDREAEVISEKVTNASLIRDKHKNNNFGGMDFRVYSPSPGKHFYKYINEEIGNELYFETETGDILSDAIYRRNMMTEELLDVKIVPLWGGDDDALTASIKKTVMAGDDAFEACINRLDFSAGLASERLLLNFYGVDSIDLKSPWWDANIVENFTMFKNVLFTVSGDINFFDDYAASAMYFNQRLMNEFQYDYPYQAVRDGKWVIDDFIAMVKATTRDLNGDGVIKEKDDLWGFAESGHAVLHFIYCCGETMSHVDGNGDLKITYNEKLVNVVDKLYDFFNVSKTVCIGSTYGSIFKDGRKLFYMNMLGTINTLRDMDDDFGVLPMPKWNEAQEKYTGYVSNGWTTAYSIPVTNSDPERTGVVLDAMCGFSTDTVTAAIYDVMLAEKLVRDVESQEMLKYVFDSKVYDWAGDLAWASSLRGVYEGVVNSSGNKFVSSLEKVMPGVETSLEKLIDSYRPQ